MPQTWKSPRYGTLFAVRNSDRISIWWEKPKMGLLRLYAEDWALTLKAMGLWETRRSLRGMVRPSSIPRRLMHYERLHWAHAAPGPGGGQPTTSVLLDLPSGCQIGFNRHGNMLWMGLDADLIGEDQILLTPAAIRFLERVEEDDEEDPDLSERVKRRHDEQRERRGDRQSSFLAVSAE